MSELAATADAATVEVTVERISGGAEPLLASIDSNSTQAVVNASAAAEGSQLGESSTSVWPVCRASFLDDPAAAPERSTWISDEDERCATSMSLSQKVAQAGLPTSGITTRRTSQVSYEEKLREISEREKQLLIREAALAEREERLSQQEAQAEVDDGPPSSEPAHQLQKVPTRGILKPPKVYADPRVIRQGTAIMVTKVVGDTTSEHLAAQLELTLKRPYAGASIGLAIARSASYSAVLVADMIPSGIADTSGMQLGDIIVAINGETVETDDARALKLLQTPGSLQLVVRRRVNDQQTAVAYGIEAAFYGVMGTAAAVGLVASTIESTASTGGALESACQCCVVS